MPDMMSNEDKDPLFVISSLADRPPQDRYMSTESLEDRHSTTSSTESSPGTGGRRGADHEFIPTRMKTIAASKPAADPTQFTRIPSNPLLISAQKQLLKVSMLYLMTCNGSQFWEQFLLGPTFCHFASKTLVKFENPGRDVILLL